MRRLVSILLVLGACGAALVLTGAKDDGSSGKKYEIVFDNAFGLVEGGDLKIGGVKAGTTKDFRLTRTEPYKVAVEVEVTEPGFDSLHEDATCDVRQQSLIGEYFIDCDLGSKQSPRLRDGGLVPARQTSSTIPPDLINTVMRRPYRERFRLILNELGAGLAGRPRELNEVIRRAHPALRELTETIGILREHNTVIRDFIGDADRVSANVEPVRERVAQWAEEAADTSAIQASRSEQLGRYWNRFPDFLRELEPTMLELGRTANAQIPTLRKLQAAAPELEGFLRQAEPFARASRKSIDDLGSAAKAGREAIVESSQEIKELRALAAYAPRLGKPLRQFLQTLDDRKRSVENDPLADTVDPPNDKTTYQKGQGFTGMEAIWNYFYYQNLAINAFDEFGHVLRIIALPGGPCAPYAAKPTEAVIKECNAWLGPTQPGINAPDPTRDGTATAERAERRSSTEAQRERPRGPGDPEAPPTPGERDPSKPNVVVPKDVQQLLDRLGVDVPQLPQNLPNAPSVPEVPNPTAPGGQSEQDANQLLDYLLSP